MEAVCRSLVSGMGRRMLQNQIMQHHLTKTSINAMYRARPCVVVDQRRWCSAMPPKAGNISGQINGSANLSALLDREIQDETADLNSHLSMDRIPGFDIETDGAEVKLTRRHNNDETVVIRFSVSSSLRETSVVGEQQNNDEDMPTELVSMPDFQVQVKRGNKTLEFNCYFTESETDEESGAPMSAGAEFDIQELVLYENDPKDSEFVVSTDFLDEDMAAALFNYLAERGVDDEFARNMVSFATGYEKRQYINLMERLKNFIK